MNKKFFKDIGKLINANIFRGKGNVNNFHNLSYFQITGKF